MRTCAQCKSSFEVTELDRKYYEKIGISEPTFCPPCRAQRRASWRNERELYHRKCDLTGKAIISIYSPDKPFPVYAQPAYWSDDWEALDYGQEFDFNRPFFDQFNELMQKVPRLAIVNKQSQNSDYCNYSFANKNCYLTFGCHYEEDCLYGHYSTKNKNCLDYFWTYGSKLCYECMYTKNSYRSVFLDHCENCENCYFSVDLKNCKNCIFSSNLRNKEYYILNRQYTKEEYKKKLESFNFGSFERFEEAKQFFLGDFRKRFPVRDVFQVNCEDCQGGTHENCKNLNYCFDCTDCEDCAYGFQMDATYSSWDNTCTGYDRLDFCYETIGVNGGNQLIGCDSCWHSANLNYCSLCFSSQDCFGCISLRQKKYCVLNRQYSKEDYQKLKSKIQKHMIRTGEWGEFFPAAISPFGYNETIAAYDYPMVKEQVSSKKWKWYDEMDQQSYKGPTYNIPDYINEASDEITKRILPCGSTGKSYKIIPQELAFYKEMGLPIPRRSPAARHLDRIKLRNPRRLFNRECNQCHKEIQTSYSPDRPEKVFCESCYLKEVY